MLIALGMVLLTQMYQHQPISDKRLKEDVKTSVTESALNKVSVN